MTQLSVPELPLGPVGLPKQGALCGAGPLLPLPHGFQGLDRGCQVYTANEPALRGGHTVTPLTNPHSIFTTLLAF